MEADTNKVNVKLTSQADETGSVFGQSAEFDAQWTLYFLSIAAEAEHHLGGWMMFFDLVQLHFAIERHGTYIGVVRIANVRHLLRWVGKNDAVRIDAQIQYFAKFTLSFHRKKYFFIKNQNAKKLLIETDLRCAVKISSKRR